MGSLCSVQCDCYKSAVKHDRRILAKFRDLRVIFRHFQVQCTLEAVYILQLVNVAPLINTKIPSCYRADSAV